MPSKQFNDDSSSPFILIDIRVWDALDIYETRVYGHIKRRSGENSHCWESLGNIAKHVGFGQTKLKEVIQSLVGKGLLKKEKGDVGGTDRYFLTPPSHWVLAIPPSQSDYPPHRPATTPPSQGDYKVDPSKVDPSKNKSLERTRKKKLGEAKSLISKTPEPVAQLLEQAQISSVLPVDPTLVDGEKGSAARSISTDKIKTIFGKTRPSVTQKQRAEEANWLSSGVNNKRWKDRQDFDKFVSYVEIYTENRRQDPELNPDGTKYRKGYAKTIIERTATTQDENDSMLVCWKTWNLEPVAPNYIESKPEEVAVVDVAAEAAFQANRANLKAANAARKAAATADKLKKIEIVRGLYES